MAFGVCWLRFGWLLCFVLFQVFSDVFIPHHHVVFPFLSTMTWAHRPHGVVLDPVSDLSKHRRCIERSVGHFFA